MQLVDSSFITKSDRRELGNGKPCECGDVLQHERTALNAKKAPVRIAFWQQVSATADRDCTDQDGTSQQPGKLVRDYCYG